MPVQAYTSLWRNRLAAYKHINPVLQNNNDTQKLISKNFCIMMEWNYYFFVSEETFTWIAKAMNTFAMLD